MRNVTISMDDELHRASRVEAAKSGLSLSRFVAKALREKIEAGSARDRQRNLQLEAIERFLSGPPLHIAVNGKMPTADERNERRPLD